MLFRSPAMMIPVSHGSPHLFDKFDMSKIGTGEGAQAYGHGLYYADGFDSPVAQSYSRNEFGGTALEVNGVPLSDYSPRYGLTTKGRAMLSKLAANSKSTNEFLGRLDEIRGTVPEKDKTLLDSLFGDLKNASLKYKTDGNLYNVNLRWPDPAREAADPLGPQHFLDWDKPLSEQPHVMDFINSQESARTQLVLEQRLKTLANIGEDRKSTRLNSSH